MARGEVWNEVRTLFKLGAIKVVEVRLYVAQDDSAQLPNAFQMLVSLRVLGAQIDNDPTTNNFPVANGPVSLPIAVATFQGNVAGSIENWHGTDPSGDNSNDAAWAQSEKVGFSLFAVTRISIPIADILSLVPGVGGILRLLLRGLPGQRVSFTLGHVDVDIPIHRVGGAAVLPSGATIPAWW